MADIKISSNGDLQLIKLTSNNRIINDVVEERNLVNVLLKRALTTPKGYITIPEIVEGELSFKDGSYGNNIYKELSEGLTLNFISRVKQHVIEALNEANLNRNIKSVQLNVTDTQTIQILVTYTNSNDNNIIELNI